MSGLFGYINSGDRDQSARVAGAMAGSLCHQCQHVAEWTAVASDVVLGRHHIGIFNVEAQPVDDAGGRVQLWLTGEFYHQDRRRAELARRGALRHDAPDVELALAVYLDKGIEGLTQLSGAFFIAVWDGRGRELVLLNDRRGLYPHYYAELADGLVFAPELKAVLKAPGVERRLDMTAVGEYVRFQQLLGDRTWIAGVRLLPPATVLRYQLDERRVEIAPYWHWGMIELVHPPSFDEAVEEVGRLFGRALDAMVAGPQRIGIYLSGGLDGRTILGFAQGRVPLRTLTYGQPGCRDVVYAQRLARIAGSEHYWFPFRDGRWVEEYAPLHLTLTEGMHSWLHMHGISTLEKARGLIDVNLSGWDGGTIFYGRPHDYGTDNVLRYPASKTDMTIAVFEAFCRQFTWPGLTQTEAMVVLDTEHGRPLRTAAFDSLAAELARYQHYRQERQVDYFYIDQHCRRATQNMIVFARSAFEVRCPFMDDDLMAFLFSLPTGFITNQRFVRALITRFLPALGEVPYEETDLRPGGSAAARQIDRAKRRARRAMGSRVPGIAPSRPRLYADYEAYLRTDLGAWAEGFLFDPRSAERGLFEPAAVRSLWERHLTGREQWTIGKIAPLIEVERVIRFLIEDQPAA